MATFFGPGSVFIGRVLLFCLPLTISGPYNIYTNKTHVQRGFLIVTYYSTITAFFVTYLKIKMLDLGTGWHYNPTKPWAAHWWIDLKFPNVLQSRIP